ncbi:MAG: AsmA-like C-terminal region-containing protein [Bacteroidota bacterium]|nr:AsmA-like C-terminal region-containing protein [Bacteroidota bacterium]
MLKKVFRVVGIFFIILIVLVSVTAFFAYEYRDKLVYFFVQDANRNINAEIQVDKINLEFWETFPYFSLDFQNITVIETNTIEKKPFAKAERLYVYLSFKDLLERRYKIKKLFLKNADINFQVFKNGTDNFSIFKSSGDTASLIVFGLSDITLKNVRISYTDNVLQNQYDVLCINSKATFNLVGADWNIAVYGDLHSNAIKLNNLTFFKDKPATIQSAIVYSEKSKSYIIKPSELKVENALFNIGGKVLWNKDPYVDIDFSEKNSNFQTITSFLPTKLSKPLEKYRSKGDIYFVGKLKGLIKRGAKPLLKIYFGCKNASFFNPDFNEGITNANFTGSYHNGGGLDNNSSYFKLNNVTAQLKGELLKGDLEIINLLHPEISINLNTKFDAGYLHKIFPNKSLDNVSGNIALEIYFKGKIEELKQKNYNNCEAKGAAKIENLNLYLVDFQKNILNCDANINFNNQDLIIEKLKLIIDNSDMDLNGSIKNIFPYFFMKKEHLDLDIQLFSNELDANSLFGIKTKKINSKADKQTVSFPTNINFKISAQIEKLLYQKYNPSNMKAKIIMANNSINIEQCDFNMSGGKLKLKGSASQLKDSSFNIHIETNMEQVPIDSLFYKSNNFGQEFITHHHIKGNITAGITTDVKCDKYLNIKMPSVLSETKLSLKNGQLLDFKPMLKLSKFVDEEALSNIRFSELNNDILVHNETVFIPEMTIKSNITTMSVQGYHKFNNEFEYRIKLPLKNYKRKNTQDEEDAIEGSFLGTVYLYLVIKGTPDNFKVTYDKSAVKQKLKERWQTEKKEFTDLFKKDYEKKKQEKEKAVELNTNEYLDVEP